MDYRYSFVQCPKDPGSHVGRLSVLYPILGNSIDYDPGTGDGYEEKAIEAAQKVMTVWRIRLRLMREVGWEPVQSALDYQYIRNCWPGGMLMVRNEAGPSAGRLCRLRHVCPWCWARRAIDTYEKAAGYIRSLRKTGGNAGSMRVVTLACGESRPFGELRYLPAVLLERMSTLRDLVHANRSEVFGYHLFTSVNTATEGGEVVWRVIPKALLLVGAESSLAKIGPEWTVTGGLEPGEDREVPTLQTLARRIPMIHRYPSGLLRHDPEKVIQLLKAKGKVRTSEFGGKLRGVVVARKRKSEESNDASPDED